MTHMCVISDFVHGGVSCLEFALAQMMRMG